MLAAEAALRVDALYPVKRYIDGFTNTKIPNRSNELVQNPLYSDLAPASQTMGQGCAPQRDKTLVPVQGIVGVPWQDIAVDAMDLTKGFPTARQITDRNVWSKIVGDPEASPPAGTNRTSLRGFGVPPGRRFLAPI